MLIYVSWLSIPWIVDLCTGPTNFFYSPQQQQPAPCTKTPRGFEWMNMNGKPCVSVIFTIADVPPPPQTHWSAIYFRQKKPLVWCVYESMRLRTLEISLVEPVSRVNYHQRPWVTKTAAAAIHCTVAMTFSRFSGERMVDIRCKIRQFTLVGFREWSGWYSEKKTCFVLNEYVCRGKMIQLHLMVVVGVKIKLIVEYKCWLAYSFFSAGSRGDF